MRKKNGDAWLVPGLAGEVEDVTEEDIEAARQRRRVLFTSRGRQRSWLGGREEMQGTGRRGEEYGGEG